MQIRKATYIIKLIACYSSLLLVSQAVYAEEAQKQFELEQLRSRIDHLKKDIESKEGSRHSTVDALKQSEQEINRINRRLFDLERQQFGLDTSLSGLLTQTQTARQSIINQQKYLAFWIRYKYLNKTPEITQIIFKKRSAEELFRHLYYYSYLAQSHVNKINQLNASLLHIKNLSTQTRARYVDLDKIAIEQQEQKNKLQIELKNRNRLMAQLSTDIQSQKTSLNNMLQNEKRLGDLVDKLVEIPKAPPTKTTTTDNTTSTTSTDKTKQPVDNKTTVASKDDSQHANNSNFKSLQGNLRLPVKNGVVKNRFGAPREGTTWKGWFIGSTSGESVNAVADGRVIYADWMKGLGNLIILDHGDNYMSLYGYNDALVRQVGDEIKAGEKIAIVGNANANGYTDTGFYFELRHQSKPLNPTKWINHKK